MKLIVFFSFLLLTFSASHCYAQAKASHLAKGGGAAHSETLTNNSVIMLTRAGLSAELITAKIESAKCAFDLSTTGLLALKQANVNDAVMQAMMSQASSKAAPISTSKPTPGKTIKLEIANHPYLRNASGKWLPLEKVTSSVSSKMVAMGYGGVKMLYQLPNEKSPSRLAATDSAQFLINTFGTAMPEFVLYQAKAAKGNRAAVGAKIGGLSGMSSGQDVLTFNVLPAGNGIFRLVPTKKLPPGEYFFAGKPVGNVLTVDAYAFGID